MWPFSRKPRCHHQWEKAGERNYVDHGFSGPTTYTYLAIYCPVCQCRKEVSQKDWDILIKEQEIQWKYDQQKQVEEMSKR